MDVRSRLWREGRLVGEGFPLEELDVHLSSSGELVWLDLLLDPSHRHHPELAALATELQLDRHQVEDAVTPGERPKATRHGSHTFVQAYATRLSSESAPGMERHDSRLTTSPVAMFVLPRGLVTVRFDDVLDIDEVLARWQDDPDLIEAGVGGLLHTVLDVIVDGHFDTIQQLDDAIEELEDELFDQTTHTQAVQRDTYRLRKELVQLRRVVLPMREVVSLVMRPSEKMVDHRGALGGYFEDLYDHVLRASEWTESLRDMVSSVFETNLSLQDAKLNTVMKKLAGWAAVIAVPTAVTGWFGQNVPYPGFQTAFGLWQSVVLMVVGTIGLYVTFKRRDWI